MPANKRVMCSRYFPIRLQIRNAHNCVSLVRHEVIDFDEWRIGTVKNCLMPKYSITFRSHILLAQYSNISCFCGYHSVNILMQNLDQWLYVEEGFYIPFSSTLTISKYKGEKSNWYWTQMLINELEQYRRTSRVEIQIVTFIPTCWMDFHKFSVPK